MRRFTKVASPAARALSKAEREPEQMAVVRGVKSAERDGYGCRRA